MNQIGTPDKRRLAQEVKARFGVMPNFFRTATAAPGLIEELWAFAKSAYLDSPLPSLFKERLFVHLSRFCAVRYCIVRHVGFLIGAGRPAGDVAAPPETIEQVIALLSRPAPCALALQQALVRLEALTGPVGIPPPRTELESDLFDALSIMFLEPRLSERARNAVRQAFGEQAFETLAAYLAFIRTAHYWTETHPHLAYEPDIAAVMQQHPDLAARLLDQTEASRDAGGEALRQALAELTQAKQVLSQNATLQAFLLKLSDALRPLGNALEIQRVACRVMREHLGASRVMYAEAIGEADLQEMAFDADDDTHPAAIRYRIADFGAEAESRLRSGMPTWRDDVLADPRLSEAEKLTASAVGMRASANVPLVKNEMLVAMLGVHWKDTHAWSAREIELLREVAERTWAATERARAEAALRGSEERLRLTQLQTGVGIWDRNLRTGKLTWTPELEALFGLAPGTVECYAEFRERVHRDDVEAFEAERDAAIHDRRTFNVELRIIHASGRIRWMSVTGGAVYDEVTGKPVRILGNCVDITERKEAEEKLRKSEQSFRELLGALPAAVFVTDAAGRITYYNQAAVELWGKTPQLGRDRWSDLARPYCADGRPANLADCPTEIALRHGKSVRRLEAILERADGTRIPVLPYPTPLRDAAGAIVGVVNMTVDISDRQKAERTLAERNAQLALAERVALVGSHAYDSDLERMTVSEGYAAIHGLPEGTTESTRAQWRARVHPEDLPRLEENRARVFRDKQDVYNVDYRIVRATGDVRWIEARGFIFYDGDGKPRRVIGINIDVTDRKQSEALLNESKTRLSDALAAGQVVAFEWDTATGRSLRSDNANRILGLVNRGRFLRQVHPDDRAAFGSLIRGLSPGNPSYALTFRFVRPDGRQVWLEERAKGEFDAFGRLVRIKGLTRDITERKELEDHKNTLISELDHRVKNVLATVSAVASRTQETTSSMAEFVAALDGRIKSMATTHELLSYRRWQGIPLAELVHHELQPYATANNTRIAGPDVLLGAEAGQTLAMVFHELATNAAKFGAISTGSGHVSVRWSLRRNGHAESRLCIEWEESGGPFVVPPTRCGFGTSVVRELIPYELGGAVDLTHRPEGVRCKLEFPAHWLGSSNPQGEPAPDAGHSVN